MPRSSAGSSSTRRTLGRARPGAAGGGSAAMISVLQYGTLYGELKPFDGKCYACSEILDQSGLASFSFSFDTRCAYPCPSGASILWNWP